MSLNVTLFHLPIRYVLATLSTLVLLAVTTVPTVAQTELVLDNAAPRPAVVQPAPSVDVELPYGYARATASVPVHGAPGGAATGWLDPTGRWVAYDATETVDGQTWYRRVGGGWIPGRVLTPADSSGFRGLDITPDTPDDIGFVTTEGLNVRPAPTTDDVRAAPVSQLRRYDVVAILGTWTDDAGATWYRVGDGLWVHSGHVRRVRYAARPDGVPAGAKWVDVDLSRQTLVAYVGDVPVYATLVSTGLPRTPTVERLSRVWIKYRTTKMSGGDRSIPGDYYWLDAVPHVMYFYADYGLHGAYWHDDFGRVKSHGCVNLSPYDAKWLFGWAGPERDPTASTLRPTDEDPGLWVWTHR